MKDEEILKKAVGKAVGNGMEAPFNVEFWDRFDMNNFWLDPGRTYFRIIFSHDFAKAFWKDAEHYCWYCGDSYCTRNKDDKPLYGWQIHLIDMVLEEEPLKYLEKFL